MLGDHHVRKKAYKIVGWIAEEKKETIIIKYLEGPAPPPPPQKFPNEAFLKVKNKKKWHQ